MVREKIIALIVEDIKHNQLINGLNSIGLTDDDRYILSIDMIVAELMVYPKGKVPDKWLEIYHNTMLSIPYNFSSKDVHVLANNLIQSLSSI